MPFDLRSPLRVALPVGGALLAGALGVAAYTTHLLNRPMRRRWLDDYTFSPWELQVEHEPVEFVSEGLAIRGWWLPQPGSRQVIIGCTGHRGAKHELLGIGSGLWRSGNNVLLFDFRGRGASDGDICSLAFHEMADLRAAIEYVYSRVAEPRLGVIGYSMGAAVSLLVAAEEPRIQAVVADSSFASMRDVVTFAYQRHRLPATPVIHLADAINRRRYGYSYASVEPVRGVAAISPRPLLLIHGDQDRTIPVEHSRQLYDAAGEPKELWVVPGVGHCGGYFADRQAYVARVVRFFAEALGREAG